MPRRSRLDGPRRFMRRCLIFPWGMSRTFLKGAPVFSERSMISAQSLATMVSPPRTRWPASTSTAASRGR